MQLPFCDQCVIASACQQDLTLFKATTGNKRVPPESFCRSQYEQAGVDIGDFYRNVMVNAIENPTSLFPVFPELRDEVARLEQEWREQRAKMRHDSGTKGNLSGKDSGCDKCGGQCGTNEEENPLFHKLPLSVTLMLTEKCNLACEYCYERFSGNVQPKTMARTVIYQAVQKYLTREMIELHSQINWDLIGGEVFVEFDLLKYAVDTIVHGYRQLGVCPKKISISLCTNGTHFHRPEVREWLIQTRDRIGFFGVGLSLDGTKECHDLCRNNSHDRVMEHFDWWREHFPESGIKGTISPQTLKYLYQNVRFYVEEAKLPQFYINPTFEGPWTDEDATLYGEELIKCAEYFLEHQDYDVLVNSNLFAPLHIEMPSGPRKQNWCGSGTHMRAVDPDGIVFHCLRAVTSSLSPIGTLAGGVDRQKLIPLYLYTHYNDEQECKDCEIASCCPSCVMQWIEDTGDMFYRSRKLCTMTKIRHKVSQWYFENSESGQKILAERQERKRLQEAMRQSGEQNGGRHGDKVE